MRLINITLVLTNVVLLACAVTIALHLYIKKLYLIF
jgi:hypothetical protein